MEFRQPLSPVINKFVRFTQRCLVSMKFPLSTSAFRSLTTMKKCFTQSEPDHKNAAFKSYEAAIQALNRLQSNAMYLKERYSQKLSHTEEFSRTIAQVEKYLSRSGITFEQLNKLSVIHVAGTKGKGSTCAYCESILRHHGYKTGFYSSPHLLEVRERIRINGEPVSRDVFCNNFWKIYNKCDEAKNHVDDMPLYFRFLTILAFQIFLEEKVDVAIIEVGIGGQYDCTNVLRKVPVVGITSLGFDHTNILGNTIDKIAWNKAGIVKPLSEVFSTSQPEDALKMIQERCRELNCSLEIVPNNLVNVQAKAKHFIPDVLNINASLAVALSHAWMEHRGTKISRNDFINSKATQLGLENFTWPGRYQVIHSDNIVYYLDGAHTPESIEICIEWFRVETANSATSKALIFNTTGDRDTKLLLNLLHSCNFDRVIFVPNISGLNSNADTKVTESQIHRCHENRNIWLQMCKNSGKNSENVFVLPTVIDALYSMNNNNYNLLATGSLHLIGAVLSIVDPELKCCRYRSHEEISVKVN